MGGGTRSWTQALIVTIGTLARPSEWPIERPCLEWTRLRTASITRSANGSARSLTALIVCDERVIGLGYERIVPSGADDRHVVRQEAPAVVHQQAQDRARLARIGLGRHHDRPVLGIDRRAMEQGVAAGDEDEPQQGLDHVRVQDVVAPGQQPVRVEQDRLRVRAARERHVEGGRQRSEVLAVVDDVAFAPGPDVGPQPATERRRRTSRSGSTSRSTLNAASSGRLTTERILMIPWTS